MLDVFLLAMKDGLQLQGVFLFTKQILSPLLYIDHFR